jgi:serine/threonine protein kinase
VVDFGRTPAGLLYLAMDYIEGPNLAHLIARDGAMPQERAVRMALQLCRGLAHAHDLGLVHRDFKPDNILVSNDAHGDVPRIVDFGIALSAADLDGDPRLTAMGVTLGTPAYAAPEQAGDGEVDHRADLFALGVTLYEMLTGMLPFDGSLVEMMRFNATVDPPPMMERNPEVQITAPLQAVVSKLMARDPAHRYQTAREALEALSELPRRPGTAMRHNTSLPPGVSAPSGPRLTPAGMAASGQGMPGGSRPPRLTPQPGPRQLTPPGAHPLTSSIGSRPSSPSLGPRSRSSSPAIPTRSSSPALPMRSSSPALPMRPSAPAISSRHSSPMIGARPSQPSLGPRARPSGSVISPLVIPSSTPTRMPSQPLIEVPEGLSSRSARSTKIELAPMVAQPMPSSRPRTLTLILAVAIAAAVSAAAVVGYQRITGSGKHAAPTSSATSTPTSSAAPTPAPAPAK